MITPQSPPWQPDEWQRHLRDAIRDGATLAASLGLDPAALDLDDAPDFAVRVPAPFLARMRPGDAADPLLRQVLASREELAETPGFEHDPLAEAAAVVAPGLLQKYPGRALLITTQACAIHCRYCFRRHFPYADHAPPDHSPALAYLRAHPEISELILSGGDPLILPDAVLGRLFDELRPLSHLRVRIHTRLPVVIPQRATTALGALLRDLPQRPVVVLHINHPAEIDPPVRTAIDILAASGALILNQAVLLAGVNDAVAVQRALAEQLIDAGVHPYYLHVPDRITGTAHFHIDPAAAVALRDTLRDSLPGYMVATLVQERPGELAKTRL